jgi:hypothetical protein
MGLGAINIDIGGIVKGIGNIIDDLHTSDEERLNAEYRFRELDLSVAKGQIEVNKVEARHRSIFVAGARPFILWTGGVSLAYTFVVYPLLLWFWVFGKAKGWIPAELAPPPVMDASELMPLITGILGISGMRTYEKYKGVDSTPTVANVTEKKSIWPWGKK